MEAVHTSWQKDTGIICLELHEANGAGCAHILSLILEMKEGFLHIQYSCPLFLLQVLTGGEQGLSHEPIDLSTGIGEEHDHEKCNKQQVESNDNDEVILANVVKRQVIFCRVKLLKQFAEYKDHANDDGKFIMERFLVIHEPSVEDDDVIQSNTIGGYSAKVDHILTDSVLVPVRDGEDQERKCDEGLNYAGDVFLDHQYQYKRMGSSYLEVGLQYRGEGWLEQMVEYGMGGLAQNGKR